MAVNATPNKRMRDGSGTSTMMMTPEVVKRLMSQTKLLPQMSGR